MDNIIPLPWRFTFGSLYDFVSTVMGPDGLPRSTYFNFDFRNLDFIDGSGLTAFCNTLEWLSSQGVQLYFSNYDRPQSNAVKYLDRCGFFEKYIGEKLYATTTPIGTALPFTKILHNESYGWLEYSFTPWMASALSASHAQLGSLRTCVKEIFNNIADHSTQNTGYAHIQLYPRVNQVNITISDFGRGIPYNVRTRFPKLSDGDAILKASEAGFTTQSTPRNMGVGLDYLIQCVTLNKGTVGIYSHSGILFCGQSPQGAGYRTPSTRNGSYPGTLIHIALPTIGFVGDDDQEEEMEW